MKKALVVFICLIMVFSFVACSAKNVLNGTYVSENGVYSVEFKPDKTCVWKQEVFGNETFFEGTYAKEGDVFKLYIKGSGILVPNTTFTAVPVDGGLKITGGVIYEELFVKG